MIDHSDIVEVLQFIFIFFTLVSSSQLILLRSTELKLGSALVTVNKTHSSTVDIFNSYARGESGETPRTTHGIKNR